MTDSEQTALPTDQPTAPAVGELELNRERGRGMVNTFLDTWHPLGGVVGWKACFSGRYDGSIVACVVVGRPVARHDDDGSELSITRYARRDDRPHNTGSWLIARARDWVRLEGYDTLSAHAGVSGNYGTVYEAAGFDVVSEGQTGTETWESRDGRESYGEYTRRKWECEL